jgi:hypothetical protein
MLLHAEEKSPHHTSIFSIKNQTHLDPVAMAMSCLFPQVAFAQPDRLSLFRQLTSATNCTLRFALGRRRNTSSSTLLHLRLPNKPSPMSQPPPRADDETSF